MTKFDSPGLMDEEFYEMCSTLFKVSVDALIVIDEDQFITRLNQGTEQIFGYKASELIGKPLDLLLPKDSIAAHRSHIREFSKTPETARYMGHRQEISGIRKNGEVFPADATIAKIKVGQKHFFFASLRDITERKKIEERLKASEAFSRSILDSLYSQVVVLDAQGVIIAVNRAWEEFALGNRANQETTLGVGLNYIEACENAISGNDEYARAAMDGIQKVRDGLETLFTLEYPCHSPDEQRWFFMRVVPLTDGSGGVVVSHQDITARKLAENAREANDKKFRALLENSMDGVLTLDQNGIIEYCSPAITRLLGYPMEELSGRNVFALIHPDDLNVNMAVFAEIIKNPAEFRKSQLRVRHKNGTWRWLEAVGASMLHEPAVGRIIANFQDITDRVEIYTALQKSEELYRLTVENATEVFYKVLLKDNSLEGQVVFVSPQAEMLTGRKADEFTHNPALWASLVHADDLQKLFQSTQEALTSRQADTRVYRIKNSTTNEYLWIEDHITPLLDANDSLFAYQGVARDITKRKQAEEQFQLAETKYRSLVEWIPAIIYTTNLERFSATTYISPQVQEIFGYSVEEWQADPDMWNKLLHPDDRERMTEKVYQTQAFGESYAEEYRIIHKSGKIVWIRDEATRALDQNGNPLYLLGIVLDITKRKRAEELVRESEERYRALVDQASDGIFISDPQGHYTDVNASGCTMLGYTLEEMLRLSIVDLISAEEIANTPLRLNELRAGKTVISQRMLKRKDGALLPVEISSKALADGRLLGIVRDITERKQAEIALQEAYEHLERRVKERTAQLHAANTALEKASKLKDEFLASMSHELRTPLNGVISLSESLREGTYGEISPRQNKVLDVIGESGHHLLELINDILDLSKIEADKLTLQYETLNLKAICEASLSMVSETARKKKLKISTSITSEPQTIHADGRRLKQMLVNLLGNAVKFTPPGGSIGLEVLQEHEHALRFTVWDTGIGIPAAQVEKLFNPFVQLDSSLARPYEGTGLGLALVRRLADMHNGSVGLESVEGEGSRFYFIIPTLTARNVLEQESTQISETIPQPAAHPRPAASILLVEDNPTNMMVTNDYLTTKGYKVVIAENGLEALQQAETHHPDIILMDIQLPVIDGLEATRRLRSAPEFDSVPIIALTALAMPGDRERCLSAGATEYLSKPVSLKKLAELITSLLR
ncbi:MAG: PAS domain S-box protein [Chloroflexi bacterium]|nr:PAS domain S-box protein [Chloroflexota bacterium]